MKNLLFILLIVSISFAGCKTVREVEYIPVERVVRETVTLRDTIVELRLEQVHDSVVVHLSRDTASYLENQYAYSYALVAGGDLVHSLGTQKGSFPIKTEYIEVIRIDSVPYPLRVEVPGKDVIIRKPDFGQMATYFAFGIVAAFAGLFVYRIFKR